MALEFQCGHCGSSIVSKFLNVGEEIKCKSCNNISIIPETATGYSEAKIKSGNTISDTFNEESKPIIDSSQRLESLKTKATSVEKSKKLKTSSMNSNKKKETIGVEKMNLFDYKVKYLKGKVSQADLDSGSAGTMIADQVESTLNGMTKEGYEYYSSTNVSVHIAQGCSAVKNDAQTRTTITVDIFRKQI